MKMAKDLINILEIGSLNSINDLGETIKEEFDKFLKSFPGYFKELLNFKDIVNGDFNQLFTFPERLERIKQKVET